MSDIFLNNCIRVKRIELGLSQTDLANDVGTTQTTLSAIENGKWNPSVKLALLLSLRLNCKVENLFWLSKD